MSTLTTQQTAELLNVSRPFVIKLIESGELPFHMMGVHRMVRTEDALAYKKASYERAIAALEEMAAIDQEHGVYDNGMMPPRERREYPSPMIELEDPVEVVQKAVAHPGLARVRAATFALDDGEIELGWCTQPVREICDTRVTPDDWRDVREMLGYLEGFLAERHDVTRERLTAALEVLRAAV